MDIFDTHAHILDERFDEDREALIASLRDDGVKLVMEACTDLSYLERLIPFVEAHPMIYGAAGLHPEELEGCGLWDLDAVEAALAHPGIKAVGEIGLYYAEVLAWIGADFILIPSYFIVLKRQERRFVHGKRTHS